MLWSRGRPGRVRLSGQSLRTSWLRELFFFFFFSLSLSLSVCLSVCLSLSLSVCLSLSLSPSCVVLLVLPLWLFLGWTLVDWESNPSTTKQQMSVWEQKIAVSPICYYHDYFVVVINDSITIQLLILRLLIWLQTQSMLSVSFSLHLQMIHTKFQKIIIRIIYILIFLFWIILSI